MFSDRTRDRHRGGTDIHTYRRAALPALPDVADRSGGAQLQHPGVLPHGPYSTLSASEWTGDREDCWAFLSVVLSQCGVESCGRRERQTATYQVAQSVHGAAD